MADGENTGSNAVWAVALIIIVAIIVGAAVMYGPKLMSGNDKKVDINVSGPSTGGSH